MSSNRQRAFTLVEILVVLGIITLLVALLLPALSAARAVATKIVCASNLRQIYTAETMYAGDYKYYTAAIVSSKVTIGVPGAYKNNTTYVPLAWNASYWNYELLPYLGKPNLPDPTSFDVTYSRCATGVFVCPAQERL